MTHVTLISSKPSALTLFVALMTVYRPVTAESFDQCLLRYAMKGDGSMTLAEVRNICDSSFVQADDLVVTTKPEAHSAIAPRIEGEKVADNNRFVITPHKPNYILPLSYNSTPNEAPYSPYNLNLSGTEIKFQISLKAPVWQDIFNGYGTLYAAYTNTSWWQAYNSDESAPFRETNHEPEAFMVFPMQQRILGMDLKAIAVGVSHQSNGRSGSVSRSWNRFYLNFLLERDQFYMSFKPWYRFQEDKKDESKADYPNVKGDDNPDIEKYMGNGELLFGYRFDQHNITVMLRNNLRSENKGAVQLDWSFPLNDRFRGYIQYFNGYGESLIDYNASTNRFSIGVMLTDWL